jgi:hypothetical protein
MNVLSQCRMTLESDMHACAARCVDDAFKREGISS